MNEEFTNCVDIFEDRFALTQEHFRSVLFINFSKELITLEQLHESNRGISQAEHDGRATTINLPVNVDAVALYNFVDEQLPVLNELLEKYEEVWSGCNWTGKLDTDLIEELFRDVPEHGGKWSAWDWFTCNTARENADLIDDVALIDVKDKAERIVEEALELADAQLDLDSTIEYLTDLVNDRDTVLSNEER